jgi:glucosamine-6-phosphate deaminase
MEVIIQPTAGIVCALVARLLQEKPNTVLGLAAGSTPLLLYRELVKMNLDWSKVTTFSLDEYVGLPSKHPLSYYCFMWENLF